MASLSMGFSRQEYWSGLPFSSPGDLPDPGIEPRSPAQILYLWGEDKWETWGIQYYILKHSSFVRFLKSVDTNGDTFSKNHLVSVSLDPSWAIFLAPSKPWHVISQRRRVVPQFSTILNSIPSFRCAALKPLGGAWDCDTVTKGPAQTGHTPQDASAWNSMNSKPQGSTGAWCPHILSPRQSEKSPSPILFTFWKWKWSRSVVPDSLRPHGL